MISSSELHLFPSHSPIQFIEQNIYFKTPKNDINNIINNQNNNNINIINNNINNNNNNAQTIINIQILEEKIKFTNFHYCVKQLHRIKSFLNDVITKSSKTPNSFLLYSNFVSQMHGDFFKISKDEVKKNSESIDDSALSYPSFFRYSSSFDCFLYILAKKSFVETRKLFDRSIKSINNQLNFDSQKLSTFKPLIYHPSYNNNDDNHLNENNNNNNNNNEVDYCLKEYELDMNERISILVKMWTSYVQFESHFGQWKTANELFDLALLCDFVILFSFLF